MRFKLILDINKQAFGNILPINYQYEQSAVIYHLLASGSAEYSAWLHDNGFTVEDKKTFKLFCFSPFKVEKRKQVADRLLRLSNSVEWVISFLPERSTEEFIKGVFTNQTFTIGDTKSRVQMRIRSVEALPEPQYTETMLYSTMSPIFIKYRDESGKDLYLSPEDERSATIVKTGLIDKYRSFYGDDLDAENIEVRYDVLDTPKRKRVVIKSGTSSETSLIGYKCKLKVTAPIQLQRVINNAGLGSLCSQGFGCMKIIDNK